MPKRSAKTQRDFKHTWYLQEWMQQAGKIQADLQKELGWSRGKAHDVWHGQQYTQDIIDAVAPWLNARPYELLMTPELAMSFRNLREDAARIVHDASKVEHPSATPLVARRAGS